VGSRASLLSPVSGRGGGGGAGGSGGGGGARGNGDPGATGEPGRLVRGLGGSEVRGSVCAMEAREEMIGRYLYEVRSVIKRVVRCKLWI